MRKKVARFDEVVGILYGMNSIIITDLNDESWKTIKTLLDESEQLVGQQKLNKCHFTIPPKMIMSYQTLIPRKRKKSFVNRTVWIEISAKRNDNKTFSKFRWVAWTLTGSAVLHYSLYSPFRKLWALNLWGAKSFFILLQQRYRWFLLYYC